MISLLALLLLAATADVDAAVGMARVGQQVRPVQRTPNPLGVVLPFAGAYHFLARTDDDHGLQRLDPDAHTLPERGAGLHTPYNDRASFAYLARIALGTPPQDLVLQLDARSVDLWMHSTENEMCASFDLGLCALTGVYNRTASHTSSLVRQRGNIFYDDTTYARIEAIYDTLHLPDGKTHLGHFVAGAAFESTVRYGRLGLARGRVLQPGRTSPALLNRLQADGVISNAGYSFAVLDFASSAGELRFGAVDKALFEGPLVTTGIQQRSREVRNPHSVQIREVYFYRNGKRGKTLSSSLRRLDVLLDPTSSWSLLPLPLARAIADQVAGGTAHSRRRRVAEYRELDGLFFVDCERMLDDAFVIFNFWGVEIPVHVSQLISRIEVRNDGAPVCAMTFKAILPKPFHGIFAEDFVIGDSILRSAYIYYDLENDKISIARRTPILGPRPPPEIVLIRTDGVPADIVGHIPTAGPLPSSAPPLTHQRAAFAALADTLPSSLSADDEAERQLQDGKHLAQLRQSVFSSMLFRRHYPSSPTQMFSVNITLIAFAALILVAAGVFYNRRSRRRLRYLIPRRGSAKSPAAVTSPRVFWRTHD
ncbi:aspartic peptidase domain-containing protein [Limtongia smithiae]|uniref:aspartic peptidase domain-containing protein n=1 Tax=Limtongia smithiae TaxID=1125753 RepID=UPI0034CDB4D6